MISIKKKNKNKGEPVPAELGGEAPVPAELGGEAPPAKDAAAPAEEEKK